METMLKNKFDLGTFHEMILVSLWTFQSTLVCISTEEH